MNVVWKKINATRDEAPTNPPKYLKKGSEDKSGLAVTAMIYKKVIHETTS